MNDVISDPPEPDPIHLIPQPKQVDRRNGAFELTPDTPIVTNTVDERSRKLAQRFVERVNTATWHTHSLKFHTDSAKPDNAIVLRQIPEHQDINHKEGYIIDVDDNETTLQAETPAGLFYAVQTLRQLLPSEIEQTDPTLVPRGTSWSVPAVRIEDAPRFEYRGMHLDVGRHLFPVSFIKKYIDLMAYHKMNRFHWHLTEDQGWRIEIEQYPKLTEVGAWRDETLIGHMEDEPHRYDGKSYGGFYTQEEIREVVRYARDRFVTVIPEIDLPGHCSAALAAYPELGCKQDQTYAVSTSWGIKKNVYAPDESSFAFLKNVLSEVMDLFPERFIHIGGDEVETSQWENSKLTQQVMEEEGLQEANDLHPYFIKRIESFLNRHDRRVMGWDEILEAELAPGTAVMSWRGTGEGVRAAKQHRDVVMAPASHCYFDSYQASTNEEPLANKGLTSLRTVYQFDPIPEELQETSDSKFIIGAQGNVWTEYMKSSDKVEYMAYPRASALAEVVWSPTGRRDWPNFLKRMQTHFHRLDRLDVNAAEHDRGEQHV